MAFIFRHRLLVLLALVVAIACPLLVGSHASASPAYSGDELIDNSVYLDANSMNANQIQAFLSSMGGYIANYNTVETLSYYPNYGHTVSAAILIQDAAQVYGVNPQVIMATLQKEESLITDPSPTSSQLNFAMGYGCADGSGCSKYAGFFNQIDNATWQLRFNYERANGNNSWWNSSLSYPCGGSTHYYSPGLYPGKNVTFYDDYGTGYTSFTIQNASTASLYCYTPHAYPGSSREYFSGSYNFVIAFDNWFGSTLGALVRSTGDPTLYYDDGTSKYLVGSMDMAAQYGYGLSNVRVVAQSDLDAVPLASSPDNPYLSYVVKSDNDGDADGGSIYLVNGGVRYPITSMDQFYSFGFTLNQLGYMPLGDLQRMPVGSNLSNFVQRGDGFVYQVSNGTRQGIFQYNYFTQLDPSGVVTPVSDLVLSRLTLGQALLSGDTTMIGQDGRLWLATSSGWYYVTSMSLYSCLGLGSTPNLAFTSNDTTMGTPLSGLTCALQTSGGQKYIMDSSRRIPVDSGWGFGTLPQVDDSFVTRLPVYSPSAHPIFRSTDGGGLYIFNGGKKRQIYTMATLNSEGYTTNDIYTASSDFLATIPTGSLELGDGSVVQDNSNGKVYVIAGSNKYYIPNMSIFSSYGLGTSPLLSLDPSTFTSYGNGGTVSSQLAYTSGATVFDSGIALQIPSALQTAFGFNGSNQPTYPAGVGANGSVRQATRYLKFGSSATLYYMDSGTKRPVYSWDTFTSLGGSLNNLTVLSDSAANLWPTGANE